MFKEVNIHSTIIPQVKSNSPFRKMLSNVRKLMGGLSYFFAHYKTVTNEKKFNTDNFDGGNL